MNIKDVAGAAVIGGDHVRLAFDDESDVADEGVIKNFINGRAVIVAAIGQALHLRAFGWRSFTHLESLGALRSLGKSQSGWLRNPVACDAGEPGLR